MIKVIPTALNGINGYVNTSLLGSGVMVSAQQNGTVIGATAPNPSTGEFFLARLPTGNYDVVITANARAAAVVAGVPVTSTTAITSLSTAAAPITLPPSASSATISGNVTLAPVSTTEVAYVSAQQRFAAGPTVTIKYQGVDIASGAYSLTQLPTAAPHIAAYSATQPLVFAADLATVPGTGKYKVSASATGYAAKSIDLIDVSLLNQSNVNFVLIP